MGHPILIMIRSLFKFSFAFIRPKQIRRDFEFNDESLNNCRQLLEIGQPLGCSLSENSARYIKERLTSQMTVPPIKVLAQWEQLRPMECEVSVLRCSETLSSVEEQYLQNFYQYWSAFFLKNEAKFEKEDRNTFHTAIKDCLKAFSWLIYVVRPNEQTILRFLRVFMLAVRKKVVHKEEYLSPLRCCFDGLLSLPRINLDSWSFLLYMTSVISPHYIYFEREKEIVAYINGLIPKNWTSFLEEKTVKNLIHNLMAQSEPPQHLTRQIAKLLTETSNPQIKYLCFAFLLEFFQVDRSNIRTPRYLEAVELIVSEGSKESVRNLGKLFCFADIWIPEFWNPYFELMMQEDNYQISYIVDHLTIDGLLNSGEGGPQLREKARQFRHFLKGKGVDLESLNFRDEHEKTYGRMVNKKSSCQQNVANSLKLICGAEVLTEVPIKFFMVDILVDKQIVIEINNENHYKVVEGERVLDLKSSFRKRVLEKAGFQCKDIRVEDYIYSNYMMLEDVYKIVEDCATLKVKLPRPTQQHLH